MLQLYSEFFSRYFTFKPTLNHRRTMAHRLLGIFKNFSNHICMLQSAIPIITVANLFRSEKCINAPVCLIYFVASGRCAFVFVLQLGTTVREELEHLWSAVRSNWKTGLKVSISPSHSISLFCKHTHTHSSTLTKTLSWSLSIHHVLSTLVYCRKERGRQRKEM